MYYKPRQTKTVRCCCFLQFHNSILYIYMKCHHINEADQCRGAEGRRKMPIHCLQSAASRERNCRANSRARGFLTETRGARPCGYRGSRVPRGPGPKALPLHTASPSSRPRADRGAEGHREMNFHETGGE